MNVYKWMAISGEYPELTQTLLFHLELYLTRIFVQCIYERLLHDILPFRRKMVQAAEQGAHLDVDPHLCCGFPRV